MVSLRFLAHNPELNAAPVAIKALQLDKSNPIGVVTTNGITTTVHAPSGDVGDSKKMIRYLQTILKRTKAWRTKEASQTKAFLRECIAALSDH